MAMNFRHRRSDPPEINLIPFIDVLLVVLIFLMLSTTYAKYNALNITLPTADAAPKLTEQAREIRIAVAPDGRYSVNRVMVDGITVEALMTALRNASQGQTDRQVIVSADAMSAHQSVINVLDAARRVGLTRITFAAQGSSRDAVRR
jgi:biopolymer transport protein ExbD